MKFLERMGESTGYITTNGKGDSIEIRNAVGLSSLSDVLFKFSDEKGNNVERFVGKLPV